MNNFSTKDSSITSSKVCFVKGPSTAHHNSKLTLAVTCTLNPITPNPFALFEHSGRAIPVKDGVSVSRGNLGAFKQGESYGIDLCISGFNLMYLISGQAVTLGSIENSSAPIPSSTVTPVVKPEGVKSFRTVAVNLPSGYVSGKASISSRPSVVISGASLSMTPTTGSSTANSTTASRPAVATPPAPQDPTTSKVNLDVRKLFQNPQGTTASSPSDTSSPAVRNTSLAQPSSSHHSQPHPLHNLAPINTHTQKAQAHMDVYFCRMKKLTKSPHVTPRMQFMLQVCASLYFLCLCLMKFNRMSSNSVTANGFLGKRTAFLLHPPLLRFTKR
jgi:hypothetical protein